MIYHYLGQGCVKASWRCNFRFPLIKSLSKTILWFPVFKCVIPIHVQVSVAVWILLTAAHDKPRTWKKIKHVDEYLNGRQSEADLLRTVGQHQSAGCPSLLTASQKVPSLKAAQGQFSEDCTENTPRNRRWILYSKMPLNTENETFLNFCSPRELFESWRHWKHLSKAQKKWSKIEKTYFS